MKAALILINLGAPESPTPEAARSFLYPFLSDAEVMPLNFLLRRALAAAIARGKAAGYSSRIAPIFIGGEHPLRLYTRRLAEKVGKLLPGVSVRAAFRYGSPSIAEAVGAERALGARDFFFLPLYPQNASSTTVSAKLESRRQMREGENFRFLDSYCAHPAYIRALAESLKPALERGADAAVASFHSVPLAHLEKTPYRAECEATAKLLATACGLGSLPVAWQSKMGRGKWLEPSAKEVCGRLLEGGARRVVVICPGFSADCSETLVEIGAELAEWFRRAGGERLELVPSLNDSDAHAGAVAEIFKSMS